MKKGQTFFAKWGFLSCQTATEGLKLDKWVSMPVFIRTNFFYHRHQHLPEWAEDTDKQYGGLLLWHFSLKQRLIM